jgi:DNA-binding CsgD family transcriptional regulator
MPLLLPSDKAAGPPGTIKPSGDGTDLPRQAPSAVREGDPAIYTRCADGPARDAEQLSALIGDIYHASIEPALWPGVLKRIAEFVGGVTASVYSKDAVTEDGSVCCHFGSGDPHVRMDPAMLRRMALIAPHVRRAALVGRAIEHKTVEAATLADTLDGLEAAMFLVDADSRIVHANARGQAMLREGSVLRAAGGKLAAAGRASRALCQAIAAAKGGGAAAGRGIAVPLTDREGEPYVAHALPLTCAQRREVGAVNAAVAALFVRKAELRVRSAAEAIATTFNLTPSELRVLLAIVETGGVPETAEALGVGQATVKTHLHRLFGKTDTRRQADLVKLVAGFSNLLAGP